MYSGCEETQCTHCDHLQVCSLKEQFLKAQNAVNEVTVGVGDRGIKYLRDFDWIKRVKLECVHFAKKQPVMRDISAQNRDGATSQDSGGRFMEDPVY